MTENNFVGYLSQLCGGDMQGLRQIYEEYCPMIYSSVLQICKSPHLAEDITSEFFLRLKKAAAVYRKGLGHKKWLLISARNLAVDFIRRQSREIPSSGGEQEEDAFSDIADSADTEEKVSSDISVRQMLEALNDNQREIVHLKIYCGLTFSEISDVLQIPLGTVTWRYQSAVKKLRKLYGEVSE